VTASDDQTQEALAWAEHFNDYGECALDPRGAASVIHAQIVETERLTAERDRARDAAVALEQQAAQVLRIADAAIKGRPSIFTMESATYLESALRDIVRVLGAGDD
jgi:hypothetical protein